MQKQLPDYYELHSNSTTLIIELGQGVPQIVYWRQRLSSQTDGYMLNTLRQRQEAPAGPMKEVRRSITPTLGQGYTGHPGLSLHGKPHAWSIAPEIYALGSYGDNGCKIFSRDYVRGVEVNHYVQLHAHTDVLTLQTEIKNIQETPLILDWCAAATLPIPSNFDQIMGFEGHWAREFHTHELSQFFGAYVRENRRGRTSHDSFPGMIMRTLATGEDHGEAYGFHLGWSGNHRLVAEKMADGRCVVQMGELLLPGEIELMQYDSYRSPILYASYTNDGLSALSQQFHQYVRQCLIRPEVAKKPRPVHYNTWEGIYFEHNVDTLMTLASHAADLGVERFVLDDGWFLGRKHARAGLGDWYVDPEYYPNGLGPLIDHVNALGMEFGLWFEPEMVNPDSELFRQHPDWVLATPPNPQVGFRNQFVLDLTRPEVINYLFGRLDALLREYNIRYIKWDMNRDLNHPGDSNGRPAIHRQTLAVYDLLEKVRQAHPSVEIESCSSGGARADYGILAYTDRIWTSDSNDALERLQIQRGFSYFFPAELMGSHVGPRDCHITHRHITMLMRASVALFGHMGMEMDLRELTDSEKVELKAMVEIYKTHRALLHSGLLHRLTLSNDMIAFGIVSAQRDEALFSYNLVTCTAATVPGSFRFTGLERSALYQLDVLWPLKSDNHWPKASVFNLETNLPALDGKVFSGESLMNVGLQLPILTPQNSLIFYLKTVSAP